MPAKVTFRKELSAEEKKLAECARAASRDAVKAAPCGSTSELKPSQFHLSATYISASPRLRSLRVKRTPPSGPFGLLRKERIIFLC